MVNEKVVLIDLELILRKGLFVMKAIGKNGEAYPDISVECSFKSRVLKAKKMQILRTDSCGEITLGKLEDIETVSGSIIEMTKLAPTSKEWKLNLIRRQALEYNKSAVMLT